jgi:hypothetical protein
MSNRTKRLLTSAAGVVALVACCFPQTEPIRAVLLSLAPGLIMAGVPTWGHHRKDGSDAPPAP